MRWLPPFQKGQNMGLENFFRRRGTSPAPTEQLPAPSGADAGSLAPQREKDLQAAWAELTAAAQASEVLNLHACTRNGRPWTTDPDAVRAIAARAP